MKKETNCPNCGAPIEAIHDFKQICPYCGTEYKFVPCTTIQFLADPMRDYDDRKILDICDECYLKLINFVCGGEKK